MNLRICDKVGVCVLCRISHKYRKCEVVSMKKIFSLVLVLSMLLVSAAVAEAASTYTEYNYDESLFAEIGGEWTGIEELGLQFYVPDIFTAVELPEVLANVGGIAAFAGADGVSAMVVCTARCTFP